MNPFGIIEIAAWLQGERVQSRDLAQFQQVKGRLETEAAARESDRTEAEEVHADVVAALAAATLKIQDLELQLLHHHFMHNNNK